MRRFFWIASLIFFPLFSYSQKGLTTVGIQIKPFLPFDLPGTSAIVAETENVNFNIKLSGGFSGGLVIRHNFTGLIALESGINYVKRKYSLKISDGDFTGGSAFRIINYEIPVMLMVYAQLGEKIYINGSLGPSLDMFASSIATSDYYFNHVSVRRKIFIPALGGNIGGEYRTEKNGTIYIGASYHRPITPIYDSVVGYYGNNKTVVVGSALSGTYFTLDLRYFFPVVQTRITNE